MVKRIIDASALLQEATRRHNIHLSLLVASTGIWANPRVHERLLEETGHVAMFPKVRRARLGQGEQVLQIIEGVRLDSNSYANVAIKRAAGLGRSAEGFEACHIWPKTCYDERYHTAPANLVLLPRAIASLSDHDPEVRQALQYRSFELYGWWPEGEVQPERPEFYPAEWTEPQPEPSRPARSRAASTSSDDGRNWAEIIRERIAHWSRNPHLKVHKIISLVTQADDGIGQDELELRIAAVTGSKNPYGAIANLLRNDGNAYGRVFLRENRVIRLHPEVEAQVRSLPWSVL